MTPCTFEHGIDGFVDLSTAFGAGKINDELCRVFVYGGGFVTVKGSIEYIRKEIELSRNYITGARPEGERPKYHSGNVIESGDIKFFIGIEESKGGFVDLAEDESHYVLRLHSNFLLNNDALRTAISHTLGVEDSYMFNTEKYQMRISIGRLFNPFEVRGDLEKNILNWINA